MTLCALLARRFPCPGSEPTERALERLDVAPDRFLAATDALATVAAGIGLLAALFHPVSIATGIVASLALGIGVAAGGRHLPRVIVAARRRSALGSAPALVNRAVVHMRAEPTAEAAAAFAAREREGLLAARLAEHVRRARGTPRSGLSGFADEWADDAPELPRACSLLAAAARASPDERSETLDRARDAALDGARERAETAAARLRGPVTGVYAFGVLLPLALVAALPAARVAGLPVTAAGVVLVYDFLLPAGLGVASAILVARRPVAATVVAVPRSHPDLPSRAWPAVVAGGTAAAVGWLGAGLVAVWARPLSALAAGAGTALIARFRPAKAVREAVRELESGLPDALHAVGRRVRQGASVESAVDAAAADVDGRAAAMLASAARRQRVLGVSVSAAFLGEHGALASTPSPRARNVARLFALAAREGRPAGASLVAMAGHFADLRAVERDARRAVRDATATMGNTAAVFAPLVGGITVALADRVGGGSLGASGVPTPLLGAAIGWYVLMLAAVLTALAAGLERGFDRAVVGYRVGWALLAAAAIYLAAYATGALVT